MKHRDYSAHPVAAAALCVAFALFFVQGATAQSHYVLLDPGHGGDDPGANANDDCAIQNENDIVWDITRDAQNKIFGELNGQWITRMTRNGEDNTRSLAQRVDMANGENNRDAYDDPIPSSGVDFFLSVHANSAGPSAQGSEILYPGPDVAPGARHDRSRVAATALLNY